MPIATTPAVAASLSLLMFCSTLNIAAGIPGPPAVFESFGDSPSLRLCHYAMPPVNLASPAKSTEVPPGQVRSIRVNVNLDKYFTPARAKSATHGRTRMIDGLSTEAWTTVVGWHPGAVSCGGTPNFAWNYDPIYLGDGRAW